MSRIGKLPIPIPAGVNVTITDDNRVTVKGKLGELSQQVDPQIEIRIEEGTLYVRRSSNEIGPRSKHGLYRALLANMIKGVSSGFTMVQEMVGVGYKAVLTGQTLDIAVGYSHNIIFQLPPEVKAEVKIERGKNPLIILQSHDRQLLGQVAAKIRSFRAPEPYKGKGIKFENEELRRKAGKAAEKK
ncbi:MAG: 50S ribosomal protein L6 [Bacteroidales bacterium]|nr:50S ribosomal protein L6 [Lentimicrobiaceae bacterium]MDD5695515.1 50S ribosomal protein L6 [Bacteroidales bacterium]